MVVVRVHSLLLDFLFLTFLQVKVVLGPVKVIVHPNDLNEVVSALGEEALQFQVFDG